MELDGGTRCIPTLLGNFDKRIKKPRTGHVCFGGRNLFFDEFSVSLRGVDVRRPASSAFRTAMFWYVGHLESLASRSLDKIGQREKTSSAAVPVGVRQNNSAVCAVGR
jgi:hypothetical protein